MNTIVHIVRQGTRRVGYGLRSYFRSPDQVFFTFLFPVFMLALFSTIFGELRFGPLPAIDAVQYYLPAMLAAGVLLSGVQNLAVDIANERSDGTLKRLGATPLPAASYIIGKLGQALVTGIAQAVLVIAAGALLGADLPTDPTAWLTFAWIFVLGILGCSLLGIALSRVPRSGRTATAVVIPIVLVLQFISGVYIVFSQLPEWLQNVAALFPLKWMAQGMRAVFLPDAYAVMEPGEAWNLTGVDLVLAIWLVAGAVLARLSFRWSSKD